MDLTPLKKEVSVVYDVKGICLLYTSSAIEVINFLILSLDLEYLKEEDYIRLRLQVEKITNQLQALTKKIY